MAGGTTAGAQPRGAQRLPVVVSVRRQCGSELVRGRRDSTRSRTRSHASAGSSWRIAIRAEPFQAGRYDGSPSHPAGCDSDSLPPGPNSLLSEGSTSTWWRALLPMPGCRDFRCWAGNHLRNHRANYPRHPGASSGMVFAVQMHEPTRKAGRNPYPVSPYKRGVTGSNPVAPTKFLQLDGLFETLIGGPVTTAGNHRCMLPDGGKGAQGPGIPGGRGHGGALP